MQLLFDVNRSSQKNPANYPKNKGITHIRRESGRLDSLKTNNSKGVSLQPRDKNIEDDQRNTKHSFQVNGVLYDRDVMVVEECKNGEKELISGYGRKHSFEQMGVDNYFWDLITFDSPYWKAVWKRKLNNTKDHVAKGTPNTEGTYLKGLVELKTSDGFDFKDDNTVKLALFEMSELDGHGQLDDDQIEKLLKKFRKTNSKEEGVIALDKGEATKAAKKLGLPTSGYVKDLSSPAFGRIGYVLYGGDFKDKIVDFVNYYDNYGEKIEITGYIQFVVHDKIKVQRKAFLTAVKKNVDWIKAHFPPKYHDMVVFNGFIAQISTADNSQDGKSKERGLVDVNGKIIIE